MKSEIYVLLSAFVFAALWLLWRWFSLLRRLPADQPRLPRKSDTLIGFVTNFFDTLGIGSYATTTAAFKLLRRTSDEEIPGTLNVGHALAVITQALIFVVIVTVDPLTLFSMIAAGIAGAWIGSGVVGRLPRRAIQIGMGFGLFIAALLFVATNMQWMPGGGEELGLRGIALFVAVGVNFVLGALAMLGIGSYAPSLVLISLLGMSPLSAFPIMMGSAALMMPTGAIRFIRNRRFNVRAALGLTVGGIPGVLIAAWVVKSMPIVWLRWMIVFVLLYTSAQMLLSARRGAGAVPVPVQP